MSYDFDREDEHINGYAAERLLLSAIQFSKKIHTVEFDGKVLADAIEGALALSLVFYLWTQLIN